MGKRKRKIKELKANNEELKVRLAREIKELKANNEELKGKLEKENSEFNKLIKLNELKEKGILTEEEFAEQKNKVLKI